jgi:dolichol kinase
MSSALRRWTHASTSALLLLPPVLGWSHTRLILAGLVVFWAAVEVARIRSNSVNFFFSRVLPVFRPQERTRPSGAFWLIIGHALCSWYSAPAAVVGILCGSLADPAAAWIGSAFGKGPGKTWAGSGAAFVVGVGVGLVVGLFWPVAITLGVVVSLVERYSGWVDDNLLVGPAAGMVAVFLG